MTFAPKRVRPSESESCSDCESNTDKSTSVKPVEDSKPYNKVKHIFEIQVKELKNIPILDKLVKDISSLESAKI